MPKLGNLTSLRFFAAMWVVLLHFGLGFASKWPGPVREFIGHGQNGVTLFFILSGFVLGYVYLPAVSEKRLRVGGFWQARFARVYPLYLFSLAISAPFMFEQTSKAVAGKVIPLQVFLLQSWDFRLLYAGGWNTPSWSLSTEAFFYLLFPLFAWEVSRLSRKGTAGFAVCLLIVAAGLRAAYWAFDPDHLGGLSEDVTRHFWAGVLFFNPIPRSIEFLFGLCLVRLTLRSDLREGWKPPSVSGWAVGFCAAGCVAIFGATQTTASQMFVYPLSVAGFGGLIVALCYCRSTWFNRWFGSPLMLLLGEASYGIYMLQRPLSQWLDKFAAPYNRGPVEFDPKLFWAFLAVLICFSILTLKGLELPARRWLRPESVVS